MVIDSMIGYGLKSNPKGWIASMIKKINALNTTLLSLDIPSGLKASTGKILNPYIKATATMTLALPKTGLLKKQAKEVVGSSYLGNIGIPSIS